MSGRVGKKQVRRQSSFRSVAMLMLLPLGGLLLFLAWRFVAAHLSPASPDPQIPLAASVLGTSRNAIPSHPVVPAPSAPRAVQPSGREARGAGRIVLILDDVGFDHQHLSDAMKIDPDLNFAVLPNGSRAVESAQALHAGGFEILCHMPMEPEGFPKVSPGVGAILTSMTDDQIRATAVKNFEGVPHAIGVNNHMGSRATTDPRVMRDVLSTLPKGTYFIDSRTTPHSVAGTLARSMNVRTASRSVFLDDVQEASAIRRQLAELAEEASVKGIAVGIGHIYPVTIRVLLEEMPSLRSRGVRLMRASEAVD